jgi:hypothetical protein
MTDHSRSRSRRNDDTLVPLLMGALAVATVGPAVLSAAKLWLTPRSTAVGVTIAPWRDRNCWLATLWPVTDHRWPDSVVSPVRQVLGGEIRILTGPPATHDLSTESR